MALLAARPKAEYHCSQAELYAALRMGWNSYAKYEADFIAENTKYTAGLAVTRKAAIDAAQALPDGQARYSEAEDMRVTLIEKQETCLIRWQSLEGYIEKTYTGDHYKPRVEEAGQKLYRKAGKKDWESVTELMQAGKNFITAHETALTTDGGMPGTFEALFNTAKDEFDQQLQDYMTAREDAQEQTDVKNNANNAIYNDGIEMLDDGKKIFRKNPSVRERFTWEKILSMVSPGSTAANLVLEGDLAMNEMDEEDMSTVVTTDETMIEVEVIGNEVRISAGNVPGPTPGPTEWIVSIGNQSKTIDQFATLTGASDLNNILKIRSLGPADAHYKIKFTNLE